MELRLADVFLFSGISFASDSFAAERESRRLLREIGVTVAAPSMQIKLLLPNTNTLKQLASLWDKFSADAYLDRASL